MNNSETDGKAALEALTNTTKNSKESLIAQSHANSSTANAYRAAVGPEAADGKTDSEILQMSSAVNSLLGMKHDLSAAPEHPITANENVVEKVEQKIKKEEEDTDNGKPAPSQKCVTHGGEQKIKKEEEIEDVKPSVEAEEKPKALQIDWWEAPFASASGKPELFVRR